MPSEGNLFKYKCLNIEFFQKPQLTPICPPPQVRGRLVDPHPSTFQGPWLDRPLLTLRRLSPRPRSALCLSPCPSPCCLPPWHNRISRACWPSKSWACEEHPPPPPRTPWVRCCCGLSLELRLGYSSSNYCCHFPGLNGGASSIWDFVSGSFSPSPSPVFSSLSSAASSGDLSRLFRDLDEAKKKLKQWEEAWLQVKQVSVAKSFPQRSRCLADSRTFVCRHVKLVRKKPMKQKNRPKRPKQSGSWQSRSGRKRNAS